jgi:hypothetical protein
MKKIITTIAVSIVFLSGFESIHSRPTGAPAGVAGGPAESGTTCRQSGCHSGSLVSVTNFFSTTIPTTGYTPGRTYSISVSFSGTGNKGFEISPQDLTGHQIGTLMSGSGSQITGSNYITHTIYKTPSPATWTFNWKAPARGKGNFKFYGAFAITTSNPRIQTIPVIENTTLPLVLTSPASPVTLNTAVLNADVNPKQGNYLISFKYKKDGGSWIFSNATPSDISGDISIRSSLSLSGLQPGSRYIYQACAWNPGDTTWGDTLSFVTSLTAGLSKFQTTVVFDVYPQPASQSLTIKLNVTKPGIITYRMIGLDGKVEFQGQEFANQSGEQRFELAVDRLSGIYLLEVVSEEATSIRKVLIN